MKWLYIGFGFLGAVVAVVIMMNRTFAYYRRIAEAIGRADVEFNVLVVVGGSMGVMLIPVGVGVGLLIAVAINLVMLRWHLGPFKRTDVEDDGSWVTHRNQPNNPTGLSSQ